MKKPRLALVTCSELPEPDPDEDLLLQSLRKAGLAAEMLAWDDPPLELETFTCCILRSCWNYYEEPDTFLDWIAYASSRSRFINPPNVVRWNLHKRYLQELEDRGVPIIPTLWLEHGEGVDLLTTMRTRSWEDVVIKPAISAASFRTKRFPLRQVGEAQDFLEALLQERDAMVQRYMPGVEGRGERALVWIDGQLTHSVKKSPRFMGDGEWISSARPASDQEKKIAQIALSHIDGDLLYARIDIMYDRDGRPLVSEVELIEPSLFLQQCPAALTRFVDAISRLCGRAG